MQVGEILAGKYRLMKRLGEGGEGSVFLAIHMQTEMFWAVKEIRVGQDAGGGSSCHELQMMKSLKNRHLPQIIDVLQQEDCIYLVMEHVRGIPMNHRLRNMGQLSCREVQDVAEQVTEALCYLESRDPPVVHLDIKPSNLIRRPDGLIKLVDFGSAWKEKEQVRRMGTDGYAAPEQYLTDAEVPDVRTDIYALGATLYRMICGRTRPLGRCPECIPQCLPQMSDLILKCLMEDPSQRFQSASALRDELIRIRRKEKRERGRVQFLGALAMALPVSALCLQILPSAIDLSADESWDYEKLIREASVVSEEESREYYRQAVFLEPERSDAYLKFLSDAQADGLFSEEEETFLRDTLHTVRFGGNQTYEELLSENPEAYLETALQIGLAYWYDCQREDSMRIATGWFEKALEGAGRDAEQGDREEAWSDAEQRDMEEISPGTEPSDREGDGPETEPGDGNREKREKAALYLRLGTVLEKLHSQGREDTSADALEYWENLRGILEMTGHQSIQEDPLMQLKLSRDSLTTLAFLAGDLARAGIGSDEQMARIRELEDLADKADVPAGQDTLQGKILEEVAHAAAAAREAAENSRSEQRGE